MVKDMRARISILLVLLVLVGCQTANAGWIRLSTNSFAWFKDVFFLNEQKGWIVGTDGTLLSTVDGGATWTPKHKFTTDAFLQVHFIDENTGWILCERNIYARGPNAASYLRKTTDGGRNWEKIEFEKAGLVAPGQRQIVVLTEKGLLQASCECYQLVRKRIAFHLPKTYQ